MDAAKPVLQNKPGNAGARKRDRSVPLSQSAEASRVMKHPSSREFFAYWDEKRGGARAPDRSEIEPSALRELLGDIFVLSYDARSRTSSRRWPKKCRPPSPALPRHRKMVRRRILNCCSCRSTPAPTRR